MEKGGEGVEILYVHMYTLNFIRTHRGNHGYETGTDKVAMIPTYVVIHLREMNYVLGARNLLHK